MRPPASTRKKIPYPQIQVPVHTVNLGFIYHQFHYAHKLSVVIVDPAQQDMEEASFADTEKPVHSELLFVSVKAVIVSQEGVSDCSVLSG